MPPLSNEKHEEFCKNFIATNGEWKETMELTGYKDSKPYFSQLKNKPHIKARIAELRREAVTERVMSLSERLELLSDFARDPTLNKNARLSALKELHHQCGDDVKKLDVNTNTQSTVKYVEVALPKKTKKSSDKIDMYTLNKRYDDIEVLDNLDKFLDQVCTNERDDANGANDSEDADDAEEIKEEGEEDVSDSAESSDSSDDIESLDELLEDDDDDEKALFEL